MPNKEKPAAGPLYFPCNLCFNGPMPKDQRPPERERESIWSVAKGWLPWYLLLVFLLTFIWAVFVAWVESAYGSYPARALLVKAIVIEFSGGILGIAISSLAVITAADTGGGALVVTYRYLNNKFVEPLRRQLRQEGLEQGIEQGREEGREEGLEAGIQVGREEGREQVQTLKMRTLEWYARQQAALAKGEPFDEPPPFIESPNGKKPDGE